ncbi:hypothetical protein ACHAXR_000171 [Thalassiosira sp. AJA248-18]
MNTPASDTNDGLAKNDSFSDRTDLTSLPSDSDSTSDESSSASLQGSQRQGHKKSVRFSLVHTREYNVIELDSGDCLEAPRKSLGWDYTEKESDLEMHLDQIRKGRKDDYLRMIQEHINRAEQQRQEREKNKQQPRKKKGFKSKVLKPLWKGILEVGSRSVLVMPTPSY